MSNATLPAGELAPDSLSGGLSTAARNVAFRAEAERVNFRFRCEDCDHYAPDTDRCSLGFETRWLTTPDVQFLTADGKITFCKHFELC